MEQCARQSSSILASRILAPRVLALWILTCLAMLATVALVAPAGAQDKPRYGKPISEADIAPWNIDIRTPDGKGLPRKASRFTMPNVSRVTVPRRLAAQCMARWSAASDPSRRKSAC